MPDSNLASQLPNPGPVEQAPTLSPINGFGRMLVGWRDFDEETDSYVTTRCFCFLYVPLLALDAYRVTFSPDGGYRFLGRVPVSRLARNWNVVFPLLLALGVGWFGWFLYSDSAIGKASRKMTDADRLVERGEAGQAAQLYREVMLGGTRKAPEARERLQGLIETPPESLEQTALVFEVATGLLWREQELVPDLFERAMQLVEKNEKNDPKGALALLETVEALDPRPMDRLDVRRRLLERLLAAEPNDPSLASRLAEILEAIGDKKRCAEILEPFVERLGALDGAVILARIFTDEGKFEQADKLLTNYLEARLPLLRAAEESFASARAVVNKRVLALLEKRSAPGFDYAKFDSANASEKEFMVGAYMNSWYRGDANVQAAYKERVAQARVVPAAMERGVVRIYRAQTFADPVQRRKELERAEQSFLMVRGEAGDSDRYRIRLGQVYYWLGKPDEGKKLFDELLKSSNRSVEVLLLIASQLRELGDRGAARPLAEEAYKSGNEAVKKQAAYIRSLLFTDLDDEIAWLERAGTDVPIVKAEWISARAARARRDGKNEEAAKLLREALNFYEKMPADALALNNSALLHFQLYVLTHEREQLQRGTEKLDRAIALQSNNSIILANAAPRMVVALAQDLIGSAIDLRVLERAAGLDLLPYLYTDQAGKDPFVARLRSHPANAKARSYAEKLMLLAPRDASSYTLLASLFSYTRDLQGLREVWQKLENAEVDRDQADRETLDYYAGRKDDKSLSQWKKSLARQEAILVEARKVKGATLAVAAVNLASTKIGGAVFGQAVDADAVVKLTEEADTAAASSATKGALMQALSFRAHHALAREAPAYGEMARKTARSLGASLLPYVMSSKGPLCDKALANEDVKRVVALKLAQIKAFPTYSATEDWAFLRATHSQEAARLARDILADKVDELRRHIDGVLSPLSGGVILEEYWTLLIAGKESEANEVLARAARRGVPMPAGTN